MKEIPNSHICPRCGGADIDAYGEVFWVDDDELEQNCSCLECDCYFTVRYKAVPLEIKVHE